MNKVKQVKARKEKARKEKVKQVKARKENARKEKLRKEKADRARAELRKRAQAVEAKKQKKIRDLENQLKILKGGVSKVHRVRAHAKKSKKTTRGGILAIQKAKVSHKKYSNLKKPKKSTKGGVLNIHKVRAGHKKYSHLKVHSHKVPATPKIHKRHPTKHKKSTNSKKSKAERIKSIEKELRGISSDEDDQEHDLNGMFAKVNARRNARRHLRNLRHHQPKKSAKIIAKKHKQALILQKVRRVMAKKRYLKRQLHHVRVSTATRKLIMARLAKIDSILAITKNFIKHNRTEK
jgi:hypothetical protein